MAGMAAEVAEEDAISDSLNEPPDETLASAIEQAREDHEAHVGLQLKQAEIDARRLDDADQLAQAWVDEPLLEENGSDAAELVPNVVECEPEKMPEQKRERKRRKQK